MTTTTGRDGFHEVVALTRRQADTLQQQGRAADAVAVCDDNLLRFPGDAPTLFNKAAALKSLGGLEEARSILQALSSSFPPAAAALARLA